MIVLEIHVRRVTILDFEGQAVVAGHPDRPGSLAIVLEGVKPETRQLHRLWERAVLKVPWPAALDAARVLSSSRVTRRDRDRDGSSHLNLLLRDCYAPHKMLIDKVSGCKL